MIIGAGCQPAEAVSRYVGATEHDVLRTTRMDQRSILVGFVNRIITRPEQEPRVAKRAASWKPKRLTARTSGPRHLLLRQRRDSRDACDRRAGGSIVHDDIQRRGYDARNSSVSAIAGVLLVIVSAGVSAQAPDDATNVLRSRLRTGDCVWVEINGIAVRTGRVLDVTPGVLRLTAGGQEDRIPVDSISRVQRKRNGVALGTLVGAGVGFALGLPLAAIGANEGTGTGKPLLVMTAIGAGAGAGLDAFLWVKHTVYTRHTSLLVRPVVGPNRAAVLVSKMFYR